MSDQPYTPNNLRYQAVMPYRYCGRSGLQLPVLSLGLWHSFGDVDDYHEAVRMLRYAFDHGITHFDLANNYGRPFGSAEQNFGKIMQSNFASYRDELIISTKAGHEMWDGPYGDGGSRKYLIASINQSLKRMQLEYVDIFYSHRYDPNTPLEETMGALSDIVKQGKALYIGISKYPEDKAQKAIRLLQENGTPCLLYQGKYNMLTRNIEDSIFPLIQDKGLGFIGFSPLEQGILSDKYLQGIPKKSRAALSHGFLQQAQITSEVLAKVSLLNTIANERGQTLAQMALSWCLHHPAVSSVIVGTSSLKQLADNIQSLENLEFSSEELQQIASITG